MVTRVGRGVGSGQDTQENVELKVGVCYEEQDLKRYSQEVQGEGKVPISFKHINIKHFSE